MRNFDPEDFGYRDYEDRGGDGDDTDNTDGNGDMSDAPVEDSAHREQLPSVDDDVLAALNMERQMNPGETEKELARRLMKENLPQVTMNVINTALHGSNDRIRFDASKYVMERVLGKIGDDTYETSKSPLEELFDDVTAFVNSASASSSTSSASASASDASSD